MNIRLLIPLATLLIACTPTATAPTPVLVAPSATCDALEVSIANGTLNGLAPTATMAEVRARLPCATGDTEEGSAYNCGGGVFFKDHSFYAYTHRDYFEIRDGFPGTFDVPVLGADVVGLPTLLGEPARVPGEMPNHLVYARPWGSLVVKHDGRVVTRIQMHVSSPDGVQFCI